MATMASCTSCRRDLRGGLTEKGRCHRGVQDVGERPGEPHTLGSLRLGRDMFRFSWDKRLSILNSPFPRGLLWLVGLVFEWFREGKHEKAGGV
jgi:hypothetical protein